MKRALLIATVSGFVPQFEMNHVLILQNMGYEVHYASNFYNPHYGFDNQRLEGTGIICHQVDFVRSPFRIKQNITAYQQLKKIMEAISFQIVHCHTPMGGVLGRLAARKVRRKQNGEERQKMKIVYTVHGFHFYRGAPIRNWLSYYLVEWYLAHDTDILITINKEDYRRAKRFSLHRNGRVYQIDGVGISIEEYQNVIVNRKRKREELGLSEDDYILISVGELTRRKNHQIVIQALAELRLGKSTRRIRYLICGEGSERERLIKLIRKMGLEEQVFLLGYRKDIKELLALSDCFIFPSKQEGLPVAVMEALAMGLPCICSDIRGNRDLIEENKGGILVRKEQKRAYCNAIQRMMQLQKRNVSLQKKYAESSVEKQMKGIYRDAEVIS